jgi:hypothetical protein
MLREYVIDLVTCLSIRKYVGFRFFFFTYFDRQLGYEGT